MLWPTVSNFTRRAYVPKTSQKGFRQRCNHKRLRLKWVKGKRVALEDHLTGVRQYMCVTLLLIMLGAPWIMIWVMLPPLTALGPPRSMIPTPVTTGSTLVVPTDVLWTWVSLIGYLLVSTCLLKSLSSSFHEFKMYMPNRWPLLHIYLSITPTTQDRKSVVGVSS